MDYSLSVTAKEAVDTLLYYGVLVGRLIVYGLPLLLALTTLLSLKRTKSRLGAKLANLRHQSTRNTTGFALSIVLLVGLLVIALLGGEPSMLILPLIASFYVSMSILRFCTYPYVGVYEHGVLFPTDTFCYRHAHSWQVVGSQFFVRTKSGSRVDFEVSDSADHVTERFEELGLPKATIVSSAKEST
jgi:hypothetical protein